MQTLARQGPDPNTTQRDLWNSPEEQSESHEAHSDVKNIA